MNVMPDALHRVLRVLVCGAGFLPTALWAGDAAPDAPDALVPVSWETQSVHELLRRELGEALRGQANGQVKGPALPPDGAAAAGAPAPQLMALYGVGQALRAEVQVGPHTYLYVRGQSWPAGYREDPRAYRLRAMTSACIELVRGEDQHALCLRTLLGGTP